MDDQLFGLFARRAKRIVAPLNKLTKEQPMNGKNALLSFTRVAAALGATLVEAMIFWTVMPK